MGDSNIIFMTGYSKSDLIRLKENMKRDLFGNSGKGGLLKLCMSLCILQATDSRSCYSF